MKAQYIDYKDTNSFSSALLRFVEQDEAIKPFIFDWPTLEGLKRRMDTHQPVLHRALLVEDLLNQYGSLADDNPLTRKQIESLADKNTFTITTGHQLNLFTGPLYFIYKIVSAIKLADELKEAFPDRHFVPVYWMATEDHDFAEINHTYLGEDKLQWDVPASGPTGRMSTESIARTVQKYIKRLGLSHNAEELSCMVREAYLQHDNLADAMRSLVHQLFSSYGLVIVDADRPKLKALFSTVAERDIREENSFRHISETNKALEKNGLSSQVHAREINFFYMRDDLRERIVRRDDGFEVLHHDIRFTEDELHDEVTKHPERFSPNVVMRPLYQEILLPNICYIGGGAEVAYWMQLKSNFDFYGVDFPILLPRNSALIGDEHLDFKVFRLNLSFKSIFKDAELLKKEYVRIHSKHRLNLNQEWLEMEEVFKSIKERANRIDPTLGSSTEAIKVRLRKSLDNLEKKFVKADKNNFDIAIDQIDQLKAMAFPVNDTLQERVENFGLFYVKYGKKMMNELYTYFHPLDLKFTIVY